MKITSPLFCTLAICSGVLTASTAHAFKLPCSEVRVEVFCTAVCEDGSMISGSFSGSDGCDGNIFDRFGEEIDANADAEDNANDGLDEGGCEAQGSNLVAIVCSKIKKPSASPTINPQIDAELVEHWASIAG